MYMYTAKMLLVYILTGVYIQWNPSSVDTLGTEESVLIREVS